MVGALSTMRVERKNEITFRVYNFNFSSCCSFAASSIEAHMKMKFKSLGWEFDLRSLFWLLFYFILFFSLLPFSAQHIAIDKTGQSHDFTFHRIQLSRMIDENWLLLHSLLPVLLPPSCVAFQHFMPVCLLIFRVVNSRNWRMGKTSTVSLRFHFSSNLSWAMHGESRRR